MNDTRDYRETELPGPKQGAGHPRRTGRLMRIGYVLAGCGLLVVSVTIAACLQGAARSIWPLALVGVTMIGLAATMAGFALMVVAANPFDDESLSIPTQNTVEDDDLVT